MHVSTSIVDVEGSPDKALPARLGSFPKILKEIRKVADWGLGGAGKVDAA